MGTMMRFGLNVHTGFIHLVLLSMDSVSQIYKIQKHFQNVM